VESIVVNADSFAYAIEIGFARRDNSIFVSVSIDLWGVNDSVKDGLIGIGSYCVRDSALNLKRLVVCEPTVLFHLLGLDRPMTTVIRKEVSVWPR
jgi:hypothetical protein